MAANKTQGTYFTGFMLAFTLMGVGLAHGGSAIGKILFLLGALGMVEALLAFRALPDRAAAPLPSRAPDTMVTGAARFQR